MKEKLAKLRADFSRFEEAEEIAHLYEINCKEGKSEFHKGKAATEADRTRLYFINHKNPENRKPEVWAPYVMVGK